MIGIFGYWLWGLNPPEAITPSKFGCDVWWDPNNKSIVHGEIFGVRAYTFGLAAVESKFCDGSAIRLGVDPNFCSLPEPTPILLAVVIGVLTLHPVCVRIQCISCLLSQYLAGGAAKPRRGRQWAPLKTYKNPSISADFPSIFLPWKIFTSDLARQKLH